MEIKEKIDLIINGSTSLENMSQEEFTKFTEDFKALPKEEKMNLAANLIDNLSEEELSKKSYATFFAITEVKEVLQELIA